jgi:hypothetical protein
MVRRLTGEGAHEMQGTAPLSPASMVSLSIDEEESDIFMDSYSRDEESMHYHEDKTIHSPSELSRSPLVAQHMPTTLSPLPEANHELVPFTCHQLFFPPIEMPSSTHSSQPTSMAPVLASNAPQISLPVSAPTFRDSPAQMPEHQHAKSLSTPPQTSAHQTQQHLSQSPASAVAAVAHQFPHRTPLFAPSSPRQNQPTQGKMPWGVLPGSKIVGTREQQAPSHAQRQHIPHVSSPGTRDSDTHSSRSDGFSQSQEPSSSEKNKNQNAHVKINNGPLNLSINTQRGCADNSVPHSQEVSRTPSPVPSLTCPVALVSECFISDSEYDYDEAAEHADASSIGVSEDESASTGAACRMGRGYDVDDRR